jgi:hypothetical protein
MRTVARSSVQNQTDEPHMTDPTMRNTTFRGLLSVHRQVLREDVHRRIRDGRTERPLEGQDDIDRVDADIADDVEYAVLQMKADKPPPPGGGSTSSAWHERCFNSPTNHGEQPRR